MPRMTLFFRDARLVDPEHGETRRGNLIVAGATIATVDAAGPPRGARVIDCAGACLAPGIIDLGALVGEPGARHRESFRSAGLAAAAGGVTTIVARPDTDPPIDTPEMLEFVTRRAQAETPITIRHMAALTRGRAGREMVEMSFLLDAGALAFGDGMRQVGDTRVMVRAMTYARGLGALVVGHPQDAGLSRGASATSGKFASLRGLSTVSPMAERVGLDRDLALVEMTGVRYHADQITCARSLPALERARAAGLDVTAGISIHHLTLNEFDVGDWRTFFKLTPPLRGEDDRRAMVEAVASGQIDIICSMHTPQDEESKRLPFEEAAPGAVALETMLPAALRLYHAGAVSLARLFRAMSLNPARRLGLPGGRLTEGAPADLVLFDPDAPFVLNRFALRSKSRNTPFDGARLQGRVLATFLGGKQVFGRETEDA